MQIITGESIAATLTAWGCPCEFIKHETAPQVITYTLKPLNILDIPKIKKYITSLEILADCGVQFAKSNTAGNFCLLFDMPERSALPLANFCAELETAPPYSLAIGQDTHGKKILKTLDELTHLLVAGTTGSGKSVTIHNLIYSLIAYNKPENLRLVLIDVKKVEFALYKNISHLLTDIITDSDRAERVLSWLVDEMERRYSQLEKAGKEKNTGEFYKIVIFIDELADLVLTNENIKLLLIRLLQKARAAGIHIIAATQSPRAKILDGVTLANLPSRLALTCASVRESMLILGHGGAEKLTGKGDAILKTPESVEEIRVQTPYASREQLRAAIN